MSYHFPNNWSIKSLGEIGRCVRGLTYSPDNVVDNGLLVLRSSNIQDGRLSFNDNVYVDLEIDEEFLSKKGDIVICVRNGSKHLIGKSAIVKDDNLKSTHGAFMTVFRSDLNDYIQHLINSDKFYQFVSRDIGATINSINTSNLLRYKFPIPPLPEQKKIAAILTSVDTVIEKTQAQIDKLKDLKTGMMQELLTKGIGHTEFKDSPVGRIPVEWGVVTVLELGNGHKDTVQTGPFGAQLHSKDYVEEGIPLVLIKNIKEDGLDDTDIPKITEKDANRLSRYRLKEGDIVFSRVGRVGSCFLCSKNEEGWVFSGQTLRIRFNNSKVDLTYFNYALRTEEIQKELIGESVGSTRSSINTTILESLSVKLPPIQEQKKIASILQSLDSNIKSRELKLKQLMSVKKALMQDLLTGKVRVKV